eukprot:COSAG01_NODE_25994_length_726_cov_2.440191_2_plen_131_part_00
MEGMMLRAPALGFFAQAFEAVGARCADWCVANGEALCTPLASLAAQSPQVQPQLLALLHAICCHMQPPAPPPPQQQPEAPEVAAAATAAAVAAPPVTAVPAEGVPPPEVPVAISGAASVARLSRSELCVD